MLLEKLDIAGINTARTTGATPLFIACQNGHTAIVKVLLNTRNINLESVKTVSSWMQSQGIDNDIAQELKRYLDVQQTLSAPREFGIFNTATSDTTAYAAPTATPATLHHVAKRARTEDTSSSFQQQKQYSTLEIIQTSIRIFIQSILDKAPVTRDNGSEINPIEHHFMELQGLVATFMQNSANTTQEFQDLIDSLVTLQIELNLVQTNCSEEVSQILSQKIDRVEAWLKYINPHHEKYWFVSAGKR